MDQFVAIVNVYKEFLPQFPNTVHYLEKSSISRMELELSVIYKQREDYPELFEFHMIPPHSPTRSEVAKECCGLVLQKDSDQVWKLKKP